MGDGARFKAWREPNRSPMPLANPGSPETVTAGCIAWSSAIWQIRTTLIRTPFGSVLFDPAYFPAEIEAIAAVAENGSDGEERVLVVTHSDWDHVVGVPQFHQWRCVAQAGVATKSPAAQARILDEIESFDARYYVRRAAEPRYPRVDLAIADEQEVQLAGEPAIVIPALGHTDDGLAVFFPRHRLLVAGDLLSALEFPFIYHSSAAYRGTLVRLGELIRELEIRFLIPGHGPVASERIEIERRLRDDLEYLDRLRERVEAGLTEGRRGAALAERLRTFDFRGQPITSHLAEFHLANVAIVERELSSPGPRLT